MPHTYGFHTGASIQPPWPIALAAFAIGALLAAPYIVRVLAASVNVAVLASVLSKLLASDNPARAIKLTLAAPASAHCTAVRAALYACRDGMALRPNERGDYRSGAFDASPPQILAILRARYDQAFADAKRPIVRVRVPAALAVIPLLAATFSPWLLLDIPVVLPALAAFALVGIMFAGRSDRRMSEAAGVLFLALGEHLVRLVQKPEVFGSAAASMAHEYPRERA